MDRYIQAMPVGTYRVQSPGFPKIVYLELLRSQCTEEFNKSRIYALLRAFGFEFKSAFSQIEYALRN